MTTYNDGVFSCSKVNKRLRGSDGGVTNILHGGPTASLDSDYFLSIHLLIHQASPSSGPLNVPFLEGDPLFRVYRTPK